MRIGFVLDLKLFFPLALRRPHLFGAVSKGAPAGSHELPGKARWRDVFLCGTLAVLVVAADTRAAAQLCVGDCSGNGQVVITEFLACVDIVLEGTTPQACPSCDANGDGAVTIDELIASVRALDSCPETTPTITATVTPTPTAMLSATPSATETASPTASPPTTDTPTPTPTVTEMATPSPTSSATALATVTATLVPTVPTTTPTVVDTATPTPEPTVIPTQSPTRTFTATATATATRTATPTSATGRPCDAITLPSQSDVSASGTTANGVDHAGGASCGFTGGGNGAPDVVYEFVAPAAGAYDVGVQNALFNAYLYVRATSCDPEQPELGCDPGDGSAAPHLALPWAQGQQVAIIVDGESTQGGPFTLHVRRRQADLVVRTLTAPATAQAGAQVPVSAEISNQGDADAGPFHVEFLYARDAGLTDPISLTPLVCEVPGLAAGGATTCAPPNALNVPLVAAGSYFVGARIDPEGVIDERDESNNTRAQAASIDPPPGVMLRHELLRGADGTSYQVVTAVPTLTRSDGGSFQLTTLAAASPGIDACASVDDAGAHAAVGAALVPPPGSVRRTRLLRPSSFPAADFDLNRSGHLRLGSGAASVDICADGSCGGEPLVAITDASGDLPAACAASRAGGFCAGGAAAATIGFGISANAGQCTDASRPTALAPLCALAPTDGIRLRPGEQVVFVYDTDRSAVSAGIAGFALAADTQNTRGCVANRVIDPVQLHDDTPALPLFRLVQSAISGTATDVVVSADGRFVYVLNGGGTVTAFEQAGQMVRRIDIEREGDLNVQGRVVGGLFGGTRLLLSPDGAQLYVVNFSGVAIFQRDAEGGTLAFSGNAAGIGFVGDGAITPDGQSFYLLRSGSGIFTYRRDPVSGGLAFLGMVSESGTTLVVSPDSRHLYIGTHVFERDAETGTLALIQQLADADALGVAVVSGDGTFLYALRDTGIAVFQRGTRTPVGITQDGRLQFVGVVPNTTPGLGGAHGLAASPSGNDLYVASPTAGTVAAFRANAQTNGLDPIGIASGNPGVSRLGLSADGGTLATLSGPAEMLTLFARDGTTGELTLSLSAAVAPGGDDLPDATAFVVAPDGLTVYSNQGGLRADRRDPVEGRLTPIGTVPGFTPSALAVSPDSQHVYGVAGNALAVFRGVGNDAAPVLVETEQDGVGGVDGIAGATGVVISADGRHVYVSGQGDGAVAAFSRDDSSGSLQFLQVIRVGLESLLPGPSALALGPGDADLYVGGASLVHLKRDTSTGLLSSGAPLPEFPSSSAINAVVATGDGRHVYVEVSSNFAEILRYARDAESGDLDFVESTFAGLETSSPLVASPDGAYLFLPGSGVRIFARDAPTGALIAGDSLESRFNNFFIGVAVSPDNRNVYFGRHVYARAE